MGLNKFDSANYPAAEPHEIVAGDRWAWKRSDLSQYDNALYQLRYSARLENQSIEIEIIATASGNDFLIEIPAATTAAYTAGRYSWQAYMVRIIDSERITLASGRFIIHPNRDADGADPRTHARKVLDNIEAYLEDANNINAVTYAIAGRTLSRIPIEELLVLRDKYRREVISEDNAERIRRGLPSKNRIAVRM